MGTHAALYIQTDDSTDWLEIFSHYDGSPHHMMPALERANPAELVKQGTIAGLNNDGTIAPTRSGRTGAPVRVAEPTLPSWADHAYILTTEGWEHATSDSQARMIGSL